MIADSEDTRKESQEPETHQKATYNENPSTANQNGSSGVYIDDDIFIPAAAPRENNERGDGSRLVISHIENENFKSYAGKQILGPFHRSFTSVVGPNGSGKSNVIESILFVFGYRAKKIRSDRLSVLINDTTCQSEEKNAYCKVTVHFERIQSKDNEDDPEVMPDSKFSVARKGYADNTSHYELNGRRTAFNKIVEYLRNEGVDIINNRFLILQGEVEQIALLKPKGQSHGEHGMLEYLEDLIGSSRYKAPLEKVQERLNDFDLIRCEKLNRVKLAEKEVAWLEEPKEEALEYLRLSNRITHEKNKGYTKYILQNKKQIEKTEKQRDEFQKTVEEKMTQLNEIRERKNAREAKLKLMESEMTRLQTDLEETREHFRKFEMEDTQLREEMISINTKRKRLMTNSKLEKERGQKFEKIPETNEKKIKECDELLIKYQSQIDLEQKQYEDAIERLKVETKGFQEKKEALENELIKYNKDENSSLSELNIATSELEVWTGKEEKEKSKLKTLQDRLEKARLDCKTKGKTLQTKEKRVMELDDSLNKLDANLNSEVKHYEEVKSKARHTRATFEETKNAQNASTGLSRVLDSIMKQSKAGNIKGIIGRLGDLGTIDKKYDIAISTLASNSLDTILVDTVHTAQSCITFLKNKDIGRANFLALEKMDKYKHRVSSQWSAPETVPRLIDLINVQDERNKLAFYHYLKDTLVADDLDQANRITSGNIAYRIVTLNGEVIEKSGAMTGGGKRVIHGKMAFEFQTADYSPFLRYDEKYLKSLEKQIQKEDLEVSQLSDKTLCQEQEIYKLKRESDALGNIVKTIKRDVKKLEQEIDILEHQIEPQKHEVKKAKPDETKVKMLNERVKKLRIDYENALDRSKEKKEEVKNLNTKIKEVGSNKVKLAKHKLDSVKTQHGKVKKEITHLKVGIHAAFRDLEKSKDKSSGYDNEIKEAETKMQAMKEQRVSLESKGKELIQNLEDIKSAEIKGKEKIKRSNEMIKSLEDEENSFKSDQIEIDQENEKYKLALKELNRSTKHWKREIEQLQLQRIPGEDERELFDYSASKENRAILESLDVERWQSELSVMEAKLASLQPRLSAIEEYKQKEDIYITRVGELDDITAKKEVQRKHHEQLRKMRLNEFMEGYGIITGKLKETYQLITLGGDAELELVDSLDPFTEGIIFSVRPPKKSWKNISNLSGGEKTLSSLALVFALHYYKPTPLYVMDEIDAALDFRNVSIVGRHIKERTKNAQFIIVSLRSNMFELSDRLIGIYKTYNCSRSVAIDPDKVAPHLQPKFNQQEISNTTLAMKRRNTTS